MRATRSVTNSSAWLQESNLAVAGNAGIVEGKEKRIVYRSWRSIWCGCLKYKITLNVFLRRCNTDMTNEDGYRVTPIVNSKIIVLSPTSAWESFSIV